MDNQLLTFARLAGGVARHAVPFLLSKYASPAYRPASLFAALLLKEHLRLNYRALEELLRLSGRLRRRLGSVGVPDHSTFWWYARRWLAPDLIAAALAAPVRRVRPEEHRRQV